MEIRRRQRNPEFKDQNSKTHKGNLEHSDIIQELKGRLNQGQQLNFMSHD